MDRLTHIDESGNALMVDVGEKKETKRIAVACGKIVMKSETLAVIREGRAKKGDVLGVAQIAGIMAAKKTSELIPLCHPLALTRCVVEFFFPDGEPAVEARCTAELTGKTGVEIEALTGASVALLTIYDMCKAIDRGMIIGELRLLKKSGGASGEWTAPMPCGAIEKASDLTISEEQPKP